MRIIPGQPPVLPSRLHWEDLKAIVLDGQASRIHLGELLLLKAETALFRTSILEKAKGLTNWQYTKLSKEETLHP